MSSGNRPGRTSAIRVAGAYLVVGVLWIALSDHLLSVLITDAPTLSLIQTLKGWFFVAASAGLIAWLVGREAQRLMRTESRFEALASQGIVGTFAVQSGALVHVNSRLAEIFGYTVAEMRGMRVLDLVAPEDRERLRQEPMDGATERGSVRHRFSGLRKDGTVVQAELHGRVTEWGDETAVAGVVLDLSDHVRLQDRLRQAGRLEALGEVTGAVAHDFNNFLTGILGNLDLVMVDIEEDPTAAEESLRMVRDAATRAANLTGQLLSFSRGRSLKHRPIDPNEHLEKLSGFLRSLSGRGQTLTLDLGEGIPHILLDPAALDQLVLNLFMNAHQAAGDRGRIVVRTRSRISSAGCDVLIEVEDDGPGMPKDVLERIFEPFFTTKEAGTGLGLATVRGIMDEARGHIAVESTPGAGTTVRLLFPEAAHALVSGGVGAGDVGKPASTLAGRVLVVEEDATVGRVMAVGLRRHGLHVLQARNVPEAFSVLEAGRGTVDVVLFEEGLADAWEGDLVGQMRQASQGAAIILTSTNSGGDGKEPASGGLLTLRKPFSIAELLEVVRAGLRRRAREVARADEA